ncbi:MAG: SAM-dependent chlorinase/fluorinase, partial [Deltaproteobacteria bacterium]|nr:SAM-dependent chlorinase/fluorinase [Deltaproteobacteria bacterium]
MERSGVITFLTDFGLSDAYVAMMKGVVLSINRNVNLVDITHNINIGSIIQGAGILKDAYPYFPEATVHVAVVDPGVGSGRRLLAVKAAGHFFVGPDNGIFWPVINENPDAAIFELTEKSFFRSHVTRTFHGRDIIAPAAAHISLGIEIEKLGHKIFDPERLTIPQPCIKDNILKGEIVRIDNFGNLITNITENTLANFSAGKTPVINVGDNKISGICKTYSDKDRGEFIALINSS